MPSTPLLKMVGEDVDKKTGLPQRRVFGDAERVSASHSVASHQRNAARMSVPHVLSTAICLVALVWPGLRAASSLIQRHNGRHVATSQSWTEGQTIMFSTAGGIGGVPERAVLRMQTVEDPPEAALAGAAAQKAPPQGERHVVLQAEQKATPHADAQREREQTFTLDLVAYRHKKAAIQSQLNTALECSRDASGLEQREEKAQIQHTMTTWSKQPFHLSDEIQHAQAAMDLVMRELRTAGTHPISAPCVPVTSRTAQRGIRAARNGNRTTDTNNTPNAHLLSAYDNPHKRITRDAESGAHPLVENIQTLTASPWIAAGTRRTSAAALCQLHITITARTAAPDPSSTVHHGSRTLTVTSLVALSN